MYSVNNPSSPVTLFKQGTQLRSFLFIDDLIQCLSFLPNDESSKIYNVGSPEAASIQKFASMIGANYSLSGIPDSSDIVLPDISSISRDYNWTPRFSLEKGSHLVRQFFN